MDSKTDESNMKEQNNPNLEGAVAPKSRVSRRNISAVEKGVRAVTTIAVASAPFAALAPFERKNMNPEALKQMETRTPVVHQLSVNDISGMRPASIEGVNFERPIAQVSPEVEQALETIQIVTSRGEVVIKTRDQFPIDSPFFNEIAPSLRYAQDIYSQHVAQNNIDPNIPYSFVVRANITEGADGQEMATPVPPTPTPQVGSGSPEIPVFVSSRSGEGLFIPPEDPSAPEGTMLAYEVFNNDILKSAGAVGEDGSEIAPPEAYSDFYVQPDVEGVGLEVIKLGNHILIANGSPNPETGKVDWEARVEYDETTNTFVLIRTETQLVQGVIENIATESELRSQNGLWTVNFSQALLDQNGITRLTGNSEVMDGVYNLMLREAYQRVDQEVGTEIALRDVIGEHVMFGIPQNIEEYLVTDEEFNQITQTLMDQHVGYVPLENTIEVGSNLAIAYFSDPNTLVFVVRPVRNISKELNITIEVMGRLYAFLNMDMVSRDGTRGVLPQRLNSSANSLYDFLGANSATNNFSGFRSPITIQ